MTGKPIASIEPGAVDGDVAGRAARRISDYLTSHPDEDLIEALGEVGSDALVIPRPTVVEALRYWSARIGSDPVSQGGQASANHLLRR